MGNPFTLTFGTSPPLLSVRDVDLQDFREGLLEISEPIGEIMLSVAPHGFSTRLHQDLPRSLKHFGLPVTVVPHGNAGR